MPKVGDLVKKTNYDAKILDIEIKYFIISSYNKFIREIVDANINEKEFEDRFDISGFIDNSV